MDRIARTRLAAVRTLMVASSPGMVSRDKTVSTTHGTTARSPGMVIQAKTVKRIQTIPNKWNGSNLKHLRKEWRGQDSIS
jgi:hypothetical protein